ncbi:hypothetical protein BOTBODRAFT_145227 [Botryobasidium botryosum FD-172 SS1]|uniref:F-box domain-containing protein n=1 Tax=Botryobasidium botryosum (strain FD-172 SS1) TaxID=930990 RepID=A0A067MHC6_BOTB1|nr:hypothetical protein BOTBODRAFT_145227 [Botryobasidium botryosum FD-172 SS1]
MTVPSLPVELILEISQRSADVGVTPLTLAQAFPRWASTFLDSPTYWTSLLLDPADTNSPEKATFWLAKSGGHLVDITIAPGGTQVMTVSEPETIPITGIARALHQACGRWRTLQMTTTVEDATSFFHSCGPTIVSNLQEISIKFVPSATPLFTSSSYAMPIKFHPATNSPIAVHLALRTHWVQFTTPFSMAVTSLTLDLLPEHLLPELLDLLGPCLNLQKLVLRGGLNPNDVLARPISPLSSPRVVALSHLSKIVLENIFYLSCLGAVDFLETVREISLRKFKWDISNSTTLAGILPQCPLLQTVVLRGEDDNKSPVLPAAQGSVTLARVTSFDAEGTPKSEGIIERFLLPELNDLRLAGVSARVASQLLESAPRVQNADFLFNVSPQPGTPLSHTNLASLAIRAPTFRDIGQWTFPALQHLSLTSSHTHSPPKVGSGLHAFLRTSHPALRTLCLKRVDVSCPAFALCLGYMTRLAEISLIECRLTKEIFAQMSKPSRLLVLRRIQIALRDTKGITPIDIAKFLRSRRKGGRPKLSGTVHFVGVNTVARKDINTLKSLGLTVKNGDSLA